MDKKEQAIAEFKSIHSGTNVYINEALQSSFSNLEQMSNGMFIRYIDQPYANEIFITSCSELLCG